MVDFYFSFVLLDVFFVFFFDFFFVGSFFTFRDWNFVSLFCSSFFFDIINNCNLRFFLYWFQYNLPDSYTVSCESLFFKDSTYECFCFVNNVKRYRHFSRLFDDFKIICFLSFYNVCVFRNSLNLCLINLSDCKMVF